MKAKFVSKSSPSAHVRKLLPLLVFSALLACSGDKSSSPNNSGLNLAPNQLGTADFSDVLQSDFLKVGEGLDAPGRLEFDLPPIGQAAGPCADNTLFKFGSGIHDVTGPVANTGGAGWEDPAQVLSGLHTRMYSRAFALGSPCDNKKMMFVSVDVGLMFGSIRQGVLSKVAADPVLKSVYGPDNIMLSATHTHQGPAGYGHHDGFNTFHFGFDALVLQTLVEGTYQSIRKAHASLLTQQQGAPIQLVVDELLNANINRSKPAFAMNSESERKQFQNNRGEEIQVDKRVVQLNLVRADGQATGIINWFGVHPTTIGQAQTLVSSDNKGFASLGLERKMGTQYTTPLGGNTFVAAFAQKDEGDASPNIFIEEFPAPDPRRGGGKDDYENNAIAGTKQLAKAVSMLNRGSALKGPMDYRLIHVRMDQVQVSDPAVLASLKHPPEQDAATKRTCSPGLGVSFGGGAEDGPGPTVEGIKCTSPADVIANAQKDFAAAMKGKIPPALLANTALCTVLPAQPAMDLSCHAEKPVLFPLGGALQLEPTVLPMQIYRIGNLAIVGLPWEVTTMAARRLRQSLFTELAPAGVDTIVIAGLVNDYVHYLTTREEYASQQYEGASNIFGPWTLAAVQQETLKIARSLRNQSKLERGPAYEDVAPRLVRPPYLASDLPGPSGAFGAVTADAPSSAKTGQTIQASFQSAHPRNDLRSQASYVYVDQMQANGSWKVVAEDRDPELKFVWRPMKPSPLPLDLGPTGPSEADAVWTIPCNTPAGKYRLRHVASAQMAPVAPKTEFEGISKTIEVSRDLTCKLDKASVRPQ